MATYKAEFMSHHYRHRLRPRAAYSMGLIWWWSRAAVKLPRLANFVLHAPLLGRLMKWIGGIAPQRTMPRYATQTFVRWFTERATPAQPARCGEVLLWPDTWNNHFDPQPLRAAVRVLEAAGYRVRIPRVSLCCQRPLYAEGMLDLAKRELARVLDALAPDLGRGIPVIGLEPSCLASFRDELPQLFPGDERAQRLATQSFLLSEFLEREHWQPPPLPRRLLVQAHCHHHASLDTDAEKRQLARLDAHVEWLDAGCCGMAGSFGFRASSYALSQTIGELALLPAVRDADTATLIVANGFSCREQIAQGCGRRAVNFAEVIDLALREQAVPASASQVRR
jgi:Fe-S oxidoreductase